MLVILVLAIVWQGARIAVGSIASQRMESKRAAFARPSPVKFVRDEKQPRQDPLYSFPRA